MEAGDVGLDVGTGIKIGFGGSVNYSFLSFCSFIGFLCLGDRV